MIVKFDVASNIHYKIFLSADLFGGSRLTDSNPPWNGAGHPISPSGLYGTGLPFPTNVWWQNMVLENGDLINAVNPYIVKTQADGLHVCLPTKVLYTFITLISTWFVVFRCQLCGCGIY